MKYFGFIDVKRTVQYVLEFTYKKLSKNYFYKLCECHKTIKTLFLIPLESNLIHHLGHIYIQSPDQSSFKIKYFSIFSQIDQKEDSGELFRLTMDETIDHSSHKRLKKKRLEWNKYFQGTHSWVPKYKRFQNNFYWNSNNYSININLFSFKFLNITFGANSIM